MQACMENDPELYLQVLQGGRTLLPEGIDGCSCSRVVLEWEKMLQ